MKKIISIIAMTVLTASLLFGCKAKTADDQSANANQNNTVQGGQNQGNQNGRGQFQRADLSGQVVSVNGNQVTIKVIKQQQFGQGGGNRNNNGANNNGGNNGGNNNNNGTNNNSSSNNNSGGNNAGNGNNNGQARPRRQLEFTGETKTLTIADGIEISTTVRGNQGRETKQLKVSDIKADDVLQVWYADKDKGTISRISVQDLSAMGNWNGGNGGSNNNSNNNGSNNPVTAN